MTSIAKEPTHSLNQCSVAITLKEQTRILQGKYNTCNIIRPPQLAAQTIPGSKKINIGHEVLKRL